MSMSADIKELCQKATIEYGITKNQAANLYLGIISALEWDLEKRPKSPTLRAYEDAAYIELWGRKRQPVTKKGQDNE